MEREKNLIPINQNIALAIEKIFRKNKRVLNAEDHCRIIFSSRTRLSYKVSLEYFLNEPGELDGGSSYLPSSFSLPSYSLFEFTHNEGIEVASPYGTLPSIVVDKTDRIFEIQNCYFFNKFGEGVKIEEIGLLSNESYSLWRNLRELCAERTPRKVNFALSEEDSRSVNLTQDDYEKVILLVDAINEKRGFILAS
jgi:hypothetical protein